MTAAPQPNKTAASVAGAPESATLAPEFGGSLHQGVHALPVRVYYEDTDAEGIVYYANYLRFMERGRTELLRAAGLTHSELLAERGLGYAIRRLEVDYKVPAVLDDLLTVRTWIDTVRGASMTMGQRIVRADVEILSATVEVVCLDLARHRPTRLPADLADFFARTRGVPDA